MRIVNSVLGDARGGRWQVVCDYSRVLAAAGHEVLLLLDRRQQTGLDALPAGIRVERVRNHGHYDYPAAWRLRGLLKKFDAALAIAHCSRSVALLKHALPRSGPPVLAVSHSNKVRRLLKADACLALSTHIENAYLATGTGKPCYRLPNMIAIDPGPAPAAVPRHEPVRLGALGRFDPVKGLDVFVETLVLLRDQGYAFEAVIGGAGEQRPALESRVAAAGLSGRVQFPGWVEDVPAFLEAVDLLCIPARSDAFGLTPLEAARAQVPMVLSMASGHRDMFVDGHEALFAPVGDAAGTAAALARLIDMEALAGELGRAARRRVEVEYSETAVTARLLHIIDIIINYGEQ